MAIVLGRVGAAAVLSSSSSEYSKSHDDPVLGAGCICKIILFGHFLFSLDFQNADVQYLDIIFPRIPERRQETFQYLFGHYFPSNFSSVQYLDIIWTFFHELKNAETKGLEAGTQTKGEDTRQHRQDKKPLLTAVSTNVPNNR